MALSSITPSSGEVLESFEEATPATLERVLAHAWQAFLGWRECTFAERAERLREAARALRAKKAEYARLMALEMGKPVTQGEAEVEKCAWGCEYYAEHAARFLAPEPRETDAARSYVRFDPLGPVLAVMPWNFPFWQVFRFAAPALMAGNAGILKHASNVPRCALEIERVFRAAGARHRGGPAGARRPARRAPPPGRGVGQARRAPPPRRERAARSRRLLSAHHPDRRRQGDARLRRGDLRPGGGRGARARRGGRHSPRERLDLRARRVPLDREPGACRAPRGGDRGGQRVRERARQVGPAPPLRRHQALGLRTRALGVRHPRVREREERLDGVTWASPSTGASAASASRPSRRAARARAAPRRRSPSSCRSTAPRASITTSAWSGRGCCSRGRCRRGRHSIRRSSGSRCRSRTIRSSTRSSRASSPGASTAAAR